MSKAFYVSQTMINTRRMCNYKYYLRFERKLMRKRLARPLAFGKIAHEMFDASANKKNPMRVLDQAATDKEKLFRVEREEREEIIDSLRAIMTDYFDYWKKNSRDEIKYQKINNKYSELYFEVEIVDGIIAAGYLDGMVSYRHAKRCLLEHKTSKNPPPNEDHRWRNLQSALYIRIVEKAGLGKVDGTLWDYVRSKPPTIPQLLKSGRISERQIDTLPSVVIPWLKELGLSSNAREARCLLDMAYNNLPNYFARSFSPVKRHVVDSLYEDFVDAAIDAADNGHKKRDKHIGAHCSWCEFESICRGELQDLDVDYIIKREYTATPPRYGIDNVDISD